MMSPEERQVEICLLQFNLEELENLFNVWLSALPDLAEDIQQQLHKTFAALRKERSVKAEINDLNLETGRHTAKRVALQQEINEITNMMQKVHEERAVLEELRTQEELKSRADMNQYAAKLAEITNKFRQHAFLYNEEILREKTENASNILSALLKEEKTYQKQIADLNEQLNSIEADVPKNILGVVGQKKLEEQLNSFTVRCEELRRLN